MPTHGPENAEFEIRKAYNRIIDLAVAYFWKGHTVPGVDPEEVVNTYKHAFRIHREGNKLAAERWARTAKHLANAFTHEAKIAYLEAHSMDLPFLEGASGEEYDLRERSDTTADLLNSVCEHVPPGMSRMPSQMIHYLSRGRHHLRTLDDPEYKHELLRAQRIQAAHEYGRVLECMALAYEAERPPRLKAA